MRNTMKKTTALLLGAVALTFSAYADEDLGYSKYEQARLDSLTVTQYGVTEGGSEFLSGNGFGKTNFDQIVVQQVRTERVKNKIVGAAVKPGKTQHIFVGEISLNESADPAKFFAAVTDELVKVDETAFNTVKTTPVHRAFDVDLSLTAPWAHGSFVFYMNDFDQSAAKYGEFTNLVLGNTVN